MHSYRALSQWDYIGGGSENTDYYPSKTLSISFPTLCGRAMVCCHSGAIPFFLTNVSASDDYPIYGLDIENSTNSIIKFSRLNPHVGAVFVAFGF